MTYAVILGCHSLPVCFRSKHFCTFAPFYIPLSNLQEFQFLHNVSYFAMFTTVIWPSEYEVVSHDLDLHVTRDY